MFNIILASHGNMAEGMLDSIKLFFGDEIDKISALCIHAGDDPVEFDHQITSEIMGRLFLLICLVVHQEIVPP